MAVETNRKCVICGTKYKFCNNCRDNMFGINQPWRNIYCSEDCMNVANIWYAFRGKEISKDEAKTKLNAYNDVLDKVFILDTIISNEIKDICDYTIKSDDNSEESEFNIEDVPQVENKSKKTHRTNKQ